METATQTLHRLTSYAARPDPEHEWEAPNDDPRVVRELILNDLDRVPYFFKQYDPSLTRLALPRDLPRTTAPAVAVLAGTADVPGGELDLAQLSRLLHLSAGVVRTREWPRGVFYFRAAGSAGGRFPLELYAAVPEGGRLPAGVHWYDPLDHALVTVGPPPREGTPTIVVTGLPWRTGWRYRERGYRHVYWDAGTLLSQLLSAADSAGLDPSLYTRFPDADVGALVGADGVHEWPVAVVTFGGGEPTLEAAGTAATGDVGPDPVEFPLITAAQRAGDLDNLGRRWVRGAPVELAIERGELLEEVVLRRSSQRRMDPARGLEGVVLTTSLAAAMRGVVLPHRVVVHDIAGFEPGLYRWPDLSAPVRAGAMRGEAYHLAWEQGLARDAAFVVIAAADIRPLDDREYREAHLAAGLVEGRLHLLAYAMGASASGMTFLDFEVPGFLGEPLDGLLLTCVGVPRYEARPGGLPGAPTTFRKVDTLVNDEAAD